MEMTLPVIDMPALNQMPAVTDAMVAEMLAADSTPAALAEQLAALKAQTAQVEARLQAQIAAERAELIRGISETMRANGITLADLAPSKSVQKRIDTQSEPKPSALTGIKVAPKYRDKETGETWSGRGLQPKWLKARIAGGAELDAFRVA